MVQPLPTQEVIGHLAGTSLFSLLDPERLARIAPLFAASRYGPGQVVAREGAVDATLWIIGIGGVALDAAQSDGTVRHVGYRGYGGVLGERGVFGGLPRMATAVTLQPSLLLHVDRDILWSALQADRETLDLLVLSDEVRARVDLDGAGAAHLGERPVAVYRRHWSALAKGLVVPLATIAASLLVAGTAASLVDSVAVILVLALLGLGVPIVATAWAFFDYWYDVLIVTTRRVVHVDRTPFLNSHRAEAPLDRVQDVQVVTPHLAARMLGYGTIVVQTAGSNGAIRFASCPLPETVRALLFEEARRAGAAAQEEQNARIHRRLASAVAGDDAPAAMPGIDVRPTDEVPGGPQPTAAALRAGGWIGRFLPRTRVEGDGCVVWRKHWWVLLRGTALYAAALAAVLAGMLHTRFGGPIPQAFWAAGAAVLTAWLLYRYEDWRNDLYVLTDEHIVDIERRPFGMFGERRQARLEHIQDIHFRIPNPMATLLNYGDVLIETAAESGRFTFDRVHDPAGVQEEIFARLELRRAVNQRATDDRRADEMARWFQEYHRLTAGDTSTQTGPGAGTAGRSLRGGGPLGLPEG